jgi:hypothetical protein
MPLLMARARQAFFFFRYAQKPFATLSPLTLLVQARRLFRYVISRYAAVSLPRRQPFHRR